MFFYIFHALTVKRNKSYTVSISSQKLLIFVLVNSLKNLIDQEYAVIHLDFLERFLYSGNAGRAVASTTFTFQTVELLSECIVA